MIHRRNAMSADINRDSKPKLGSAVIDTQHEILFDLVKDFQHAIGVGANIKILDALLGVLLNYAFYHFQTEEDYIKDHSEYPAHCLEHYALIKQLNLFIIDIRNDRFVKKDQTPAQFLEEWLLDHIERYDKPFFLHETVAQRISEEPDTVDPYEQNIMERRQHARISHDEVVDGDIVADCYNATQLKKGKAKIIDMSPGGLKLHSAGSHAIDDLLIVTCSIGRNFRMKEKVKVITAHDLSYGVEFLSPAEETILFFKELYGSVHLNRVKFK